MLLHGYRERDPALNIKSANQGLQTIPNKLVGNACTATNPVSYHALLLLIWLLLVLVFQFFSGLFLSFLPDPRSVHKITGLFLICIAKSIA